MKEFELTEIEKNFYELAKLYIDNIMPQVEIGQYRVDFLIPQSNLVIELDGHEFHKTRKQRTHDAERERWLKNQGYDVLRYTGTEINKNTAKCVYELIKFLDTLKNDESVKSKNAIYIDGEFINRSIFEFARRHKEIYGEIKISGRKSLRNFFIWIAETSRWEGDIDVYMFSIPGKLVGSIFEIDIDINEPIEYIFGKIYVKYYLVELIMPSLMTHMISRKKIMDNILLVADDSGYENYLEAENIIPVIFTDGDNDLRILSKKWFDIECIIGKLYDLELHEIY